MSTEEHKKKHWPFVCKNCGSKNVYRSLMISVNEAGEYNQHDSEECECADCFEDCSEDFKDYDKALKKQTGTGWKIPQD